MISLREVLRTPLLQVGLCHPRPHHPLPIDMRRFHQPRVGWIFRVTCLQVFC
jgi:hypothetical protein